jgi:hypothetical protein
MSKHTPGPWVATCSDVVGERPIGDSGLRFWNVEESDGPKYRGNVASVFSAEHIGGITIAERNANARLIAAAPDLLEALEGTLGLLRQAQDILTAYLHPDSARDGDEAVSALLGLLDGPEQRAIETPARAAIAKAKGETP